MIEGNTFDIKQKGRNLMFSKIRKRVTFANVVMTLALVFAMSGGAYAAKKWVITSTKQIKPSVLTQLKGKNGTNGVNGTNGTNGKDGVNGKDGSPGLPGKDGAPGVPGAGGKEGSPWTAGGTLPKGASEKGQWGTFKFAQKVIYLSAVPISFTIPLKASPEAHYIAPLESPPEGCKGSFEKPEAESGNLCVFAKAVEGSEFSGFNNGEGEGQAGATGTVMVWQVQESQASIVAAYGTWAVTG